MTPRKTLLQILFPKARAEIFRLLFGNKARPRYVRELMGDSSLALRSLQDELKRLSVLGLVVSRYDGFRRFFAANTAHPLFRELSRIAEFSDRLPRARCSDFTRASRIAGRKKSAKTGGPRFAREPRWGIFSSPRPKS